METAPPSSSPWTAAGKKEGRRWLKREQQQQWGHVPEPAPSSLGPLLEAPWLGVGVGRTHPGPHSPPQIASLRTQPFSSGRRLRHTERRKRERTSERQGGGGTNEGRGARRGQGPWKPHPHAHPGEGHAACGGEAGVKAEGPRGGGAKGLSRSHASHCAPSRTPAQRPRT